MKKKRGWANRANAKRVMKKTIKIGITIVADVIAIILTIVTIKSIRKNRKKIKESKKLVPSQEIQYFREMPREDATPAENTYGYMYLMMNTNFSNSFSSAITNSMSSAYSSATGGGGGFSGGGRRPDGGRWWPEAEDKFRKMFHFTKIYVIIILLLFRLNYPNKKM